MPNDILNINYSDDQNDLIDKLNSNFDQIIELHGGIQGIRGLTGEIGMAGEIGDLGKTGLAGVRGTRWFLSSSAPLGGTGDNLILGDYWVNSLNDSVNIFTDTGWSYSGYDFHNNTGELFRILPPRSSPFSPYYAVSGITANSSIIFNTDSPFENSLVLSDLDVSIENTNPKLAKVSIYSDPKNGKSLLSFNRDSFGSNKSQNYPRISWSSYLDGSDDSLDFLSADPFGSLIKGHTGGSSYTYKIGGSLKIFNDTPYIFDNINDKYIFNCLYLDYGRGPSGGFSGMESKGGFSIISKNIHFYSSNLEISSFGVNDGLDYNSIVTSVDGSGVVYPDRYKKRSISYVDTQVISTQGAFRIPKPQFPSYSNSFAYKNGISNFFYNNVGVWVKRGLNISPTSYANTPSLKIINNKNPRKKDVDFNLPGLDDYWWYEISENYPNYFYNSALTIARIGRVAPSVLLDDVYYINLKSGMGITGESQFYFNANGKIKTGKLFTTYTVPKNIVYDNPIIFNGPLFAIPSIQKVSILPSDPINLPPDTEAKPSWFFLTQPFVDDIYKSEASKGSGFPMWNSFIPVNGNVVVISPPPDLNYIGIGFDSSIYGFFSANNRFTSWGGSISFTVFCAPEVYPSGINLSTGLPDPVPSSLPSTGFRCIGIGQTGYGNGSLGDFPAPDITPIVKLPFKAPAIDFTLYQTQQNGSNVVTVYWRAYEPFTLYNNGSQVYFPLPIDGTYVKPINPSGPGGPGGTGGFFTVSRPS